jgi:DNA-binding SARP family transcriptional activator
VHVRLLGTPRIVDDDGVEREVRGQKPWALLARIVLSERPITRRQLSAELFPDTVDPLGSLRWNLASLRKTFDRADLFSGDPIAPQLGPGIEVDVLELAEGRFDPANVGDLLDSQEVTSSPEFRTWLLVARQQLAARLDGALRARTIRSLSLGEWEAAVATAELAARRAPFDEGAQVLLAKALVMSGHSDAAERHVRDVEALFREELGMEPSAALRSATRRTVAEPPPGVSSTAVASTLLDAGKAALSAGAIDAGIECLRRAVAESDDGADRQLHGRCLLELGSALVHSVRGFDDEGSILLEQAVHDATAVGDAATAVAALRERGYSDALLGRRFDADRHLALATEVADGDLTLMAGVEAVRAFNLTDWGRVDDGIAAHRRALETARRVGDQRREAWTLGLGAWAHMTVGDADAALGWASECVLLVRTLRWMSFEPWPNLVIVEARHQQHGLAAGAAELERSFAMSCQLADPCWEGASCRMFALRHSAQGDHDGARRWVRDAYVRGTRVSDAWVGMLAAIRETDAAVRLAAGDETGAEHALRELIAFSARHQLDGVLSRGLQQLETLRC